jgi:transcriptional regulator with XRE-family HTH domain
VTLGNAARLARGRAGLTQAEVADGMGVAPEVYGRMERGHMLPSVPSLLRLCMTLRSAPDELMGFSPAPSPLESARRASKVPGDLDDTPDIRRLLRYLKRLDPRRVKLISQVTVALLVR